MGSSSGLTNSMHFAKIRRDSVRLEFKNRRITVYKFKKNKKSGKYVKKTR
jgi:hypothetical protein